MIGIWDFFVYNVENFFGVVYNWLGLVIGGGGVVCSVVYVLWKWLKVIDIYFVNCDFLEVDVVI